ncbi:histone deacetylase domain-containing protein [Coprinopsis sp. MPI-PUGE-AT-0042]|nr:histone deacetylase domain-containing protein [Coprinopsis sp. MPI-PUGE-AT-0042]
MAPKRSGIFLQGACLEHRYIRNNDLSAIVERPERLRAVNIGLAAAIAHLEDLLEPQDPEDASGDDLAAALDRMKLEAPINNLDDLPSKIPIIQTEARVDLLNNNAVKFIHGDIDGDVYLESLKKWAKESADKIAQGESEIPEGYSQGDLYLRPSSINAIEGSLGAVCEAVDQVVNTSRGQSVGVHRAFVGIRPPGHHCGEDTPSGFCFVNNVAVAAAHAHLAHGINRIVIFDIDLHHGNGTQSIAWQVNEESYRLQLEKEGGAPNTNTGPQIYYGSIHDILSYPCEDGKPELVQAASVSLHGAHGQHIENVHLQTYTSEEHFWTDLYPKRYSRLLRKAEEFLDSTGGPGDDVIIFVSCGMDACEHEYESMSRHNRKVPTGFYYQFARDACAFSDRYAQGRVVSVLEGGYSDRALTSASMAHFVGLSDLPEGVKVDQSWWSVENLVELEKATKKRRGGRASLPASNATRRWIERTLSILAPIDSTVVPPPTTSKAQPPQMLMTLRDRSKRPTPSPSPAPPSTARSSPAKPKAKGGGKGRKSAPGAGAGVVLAPIPTLASSSSAEEGEVVDILASTSSGEDSVMAPAQNVPLGGGSTQEQVKVKRVILKLGPQAPPGGGS